jgi:hypothetical protein
MEVPMPFVPFHDFFPEIAERETRTVTVLDGSAWGIPAANYGLLELYCDERRCDCRRMYFLVASSAAAKPVAAIGYGWESPEYYARWMKSDDIASARAASGAALNPLSPQSKVAPAVLRMVRELALQDEAYIDRLKAHYMMVRRIIDGGGLPLDSAARKQRQRKRAKLLAARKENRRKRK